MYQFNPQTAYGYCNIPQNVPPPWWGYPMPMPPANKGGKKGKRGNVRKPNLSELLKEALDSRDNLDIIIERLSKKDKKDEPKKDDKKKFMFSLWDTMLLLTILALPLSLFQLGIARQ